MQNALDSIYYIIHSTIGFLYGLQIFEGVRLLYVFVAVGLLTVVIRFFVSVPYVVGVHHD